MKPVPLAFFPEGVQIPNLKQPRDAASPAKYPAEDPRDFPLALLATLRRGGR